MPDGVVTAAFMNYEEPLQPTTRETLQGERIRLRAPVGQDKQDRMIDGRDAEFSRMVGGDPQALRPLTEVDVAQWYDRLCRDPLQWVIEADERCIGNARLHALDREHRHARYAIGIFSPRYWNCGYGTEATRLVLRFAFEQLHLHRVDLRVLEINHRAVACYHKCGFVIEGVEREGALIGGQWHSDVMMSILEQEYQAMAR